MRISDWSSDVCSSDLLRKARGHSRSGMGQDLREMFCLAKAALPHMAEGSAIINTSSINANTPRPTLLPYATTKDAVRNFTGGLAVEDRKSTRLNSSH